MSIVKLKITDSEQWGKTVKLPIVGKVTYSEDGSFEVSSQEIASQLLSIESLKLTSSSSKTITQPKVETKPVSKVEEAKSSEEVKTEAILGQKVLNPKKEDGSIKTQQELLDESTKAQLQEMAKSLDFPRKEWESLNKGLLIEYIIKKSEPILPGE